MSGTLYHHLGGFHSIEAAVDLFYQRVTCHEQLAPHFSEMRSMEVRTRQCGWLTAALGGPINQWNQYPVLFPDLSVEETENAQNILKSTLIDLGIDGELAASVIQVMRSSCPALEMKGSRQRAGLGSFG